MKILKKILAILAVLVIVYAIFCAVSPDKYSSKSEVTINASPEKIYTDLIDLKNHANWGVWFKIDPNMTTEYTKDGKGMGAKSTWKSEHREVGNGSQEIIEAVPYSKIRTELLFERDETPNYANFIIQPEGNGSKLTWEMEEFDVGFFQRGMMRMIGMQDILDKSFSDGLKNFKELMEK